MQINERTRVDEAVSEIAVLLAAAHERLTKFQQIVSPTLLTSTKRLDKSPEPSVHELESTSSERSCTISKSNTLPMINQLRKLSAKQLQEMRAAMNLGH
jgi:hypothetical protein